MRIYLNNVKFHPEPYGDDTRSRNLYKKLVKLYQKLTPNIAQLGASWYQKLSNTADQSNRAILVICIGASFWYSVYKFHERVSPLLGFS